MGAFMAGWSQHCRAYGGQGHKGTRPGPFQEVSATLNQEASQNRIEQMVSERGPEGLWFPWQATSQPLWDHAVAFPTCPGPQEGTQAESGTGSLLEVRSPGHCHRLTDQMGPLGTGSQLQAGGELCPRYSPLRVRVETSAAKHRLPDGPGLVRSWLSITERGGAAVDSLSTRELSGHTGIRPRGDGARAACWGGSSG